MLSKKIAEELLICGGDAGEFMPMGTIRKLAEVIEREDYAARKSSNRSLIYIGRLIQAEARRVLSGKGRK